MTRAKDPGANYEALKEELDEVMARLAREDLDIDKALECYERGLQLVKELEKYLETAENKITELKTKLGGTKA